MSRDRNDYLQVRKDGELVNEIQFDAYLDTVCMTVFAAGGAVETQLELTP